LRWGGGEWRHLKEIIQEIEKYDGISVGEKRK